MSNMRFASLCSGLEVFTMVVTAIKRALRLYGFEEPTVVHELSCEIDDKKRALCTTISPGVKHVYADLLELAEGAAFDEVDQCTNSPESPNVVAAGFSCKDLSSISNFKVKFSGTKGTSIKTFKASVKCIAQWKPAMVILENVKAATASRSCDNGKRPVDFIDSELGKIGYIGAHRICDSKMFGVPQRRARAWWIYFRIGEGNPESAIACTSRFQSRPVAVKDFIPVSEQTFIKPAGKWGAGTRWKQKCKDFQKQHGIKDYEIENAKKIIRQSHFHKTLTMRNVTNIACSLALHLFKYKKDPIVTPLFIQYDQDVPRQPVGTNIVPCIMPKGRYWFVSGIPEQQRPLFAKDMLLLQGVGPEEYKTFKLEKLSETLKKDLAGNAFNGEVCCAITLSGILHMRA